MREHRYEVAKGKEVRPEFVGKSVGWMKAETIGEALGLGTDVAAQITALISGATKGTNPHFDSEKALVAAGEQQRDIAVREDIRGTLGKPEGTLEAASKVANELTIGAPRSGGGVAKVVKPETAAARGAKSTGNRLFEKCRGDEKFLARMVKDGIVDQGEYDAWLAVNPATQPTA